MKEVNIQDLVTYDNYLFKNIPNDIIIVGKIKILFITNNYEQLDLSKVECVKIYYYNQEEESIKNHILPDSLEELYCHSNEITILPNLPNSLKYLDCSDNKLSILPNLPNSLKYLYCYYNQLTFLPDLPNSLIDLNCYNNQLTLLPNLPNLLENLFCGCNNLTVLPDLPNSLKTLYCDNNRLTSLPNFSHIDHELELSFIQDKPIDYIPYNKNINLYRVEDNKINIIGYPNNPITNQEELDQYMDYIKNYQLNRIKSARK
tara:strand:- start:19 stop:798 length:780 start_codon:yes stop_codon:yes gene_type:complete